MEQTFARELLDFLDASPSCYHAAANVAAALEQAGYRHLMEFEPWHLERGGAYYVMRGDSTVAAFRIPQGPVRGFLLAAGHSDSPTLKLRQEAETASPGNCLRLSVEPYGGGIWRSWLDRPLSVAGRVMVRDGDAIRSRLVNIDRDLLVIPSVAIHMDREVNKKGGLDPARDLSPLFAEGAEPGRFRAMVADCAGVSEADLLSTELFLYPRTPGTLLGPDGDLIAAPRLDDLQCVFACLRGFLAAEPGESIPVLCVFNNEEVGSGTRQGADSTFLSDVLSRISGGMEWDSETAHAALGNSFLVSADNAHAVHPAHPEYADAGERPVLGGGIVIKYSAAQRYTTDALSTALFQRVCELAEVPIQRFSNRPDLPGGSTLGNISSAHLSIPSVDIGLPQLAMHASCEVSSVRDTQALVRAMTVYFGRSFRRLPDGGAAI